jgi:hypothetical protein
MKPKNDGISACGIDCVNECDIFKVPFDPEVADRVRAWLKRMKVKNLPSSLRGATLCLGCRNDRSVHWTPDCWILKCCVDDKRLQTCAECKEFPCLRLEGRGQRDPRYARGLAHLKKIRRATKR